MKLSCNRRRGERGYILLLLVFFVAVLAIGALAAVPSIITAIRRDREQELVHRGCEYARAIRKFYRKNGSYPASLDQLDAGQIKYLRKRYKDPITGQEFKLLHPGDVKLTAPGAGPGAQLGTSVSDMSAQQQTGNTTGAAGQKDQTGQGSGTQPFSLGNSPSSAPGGSGGGPIIGVASTSKAQSIMEFGDFNHYNDWSFIYAGPTTDRGGLIRTPYDPKAAVAAAPQVGTPAGTQTGGTQTGQPQQQTGQGAGPGAATPR